MQEPSESKIGLNDLITILFKHKKKIQFCTLIGLVAAGFYYFLSPPPYLSQAKLLVRYVLDTNAVDSIESQIKTPGSSSYNENLLTSEIEILTSWDLAEQIVDSVEAKYFQKNGMRPVDKNKEAKGILQGLTVTALKGSNVLLISYKNKNPKLAVHVLQDLVKFYFVKHLEVHRSASAFDYVSNEAEQVRLELKKMNEELKGLKAKAGIISLAESTSSLTVAMTKSEEALHSAEAETAEQQARVKVMEGGQSTPSDEESIKPDIDGARGQNCQALTAEILRLNQSKLDLLTRYTTESRNVQVIQVQIQDLENKRAEWVNKYPNLLNFTSLPLSTRDIPTGVHFEKARLAALEGRVETLKSQLKGYKEQTSFLTEIGPQIAQLEQKKEIEESNYKYFQNSLEKARIDEALDPAKIPNISVIQKPSPALRDTENKNKILIGLCLGGLILGLVLALFIELEVDQSIKRSTELESMQIPKILSIPDFTHNGYARLHSNKRVLKKNKLNSSVKNNHLCNKDHFIRSYCESLRDRLILHFHLNHMTRKPKLVAVTSCSKGAGTSTIASGLAAVLSETKDGKVLLVDMNDGQKNCHPIFTEPPIASLTEAIQMGNLIPATAENLYLAQAKSEHPGQEGLIPKKFYDMIPDLKCCDFDYIIFDMPPLNRGSTTLAMAGFMDKVLLVIEAEVSQRDTIKRGFKELITENANVSSVFNKSKYYGLQSMNHEI